MKYNVCMISFYFGKWPNFINLFLKSCRHNPSIDFIIVTDCGPLPQAPDNVKIVSKFFQEFKQMVSDRLGLQVKLDRAYKLCDFKNGL